MRWTNASQQHNGDGWDIYLIELCLQSRQQSKEIFRRHRKKVRCEQSADGVSVNVQGDSGRRMRLNQIGQTSVQSSDGARAWALPCCRSESQSVALKTMMMHCLQQETSDRHRTGRWLFAAPHSPSAQAAHYE